MEYVPNYKERIRNIVNNEKKKRRILAALLAVSMSLNAVHGVGKLINNISDEYKYINDTKQYESLINDNTKRTIDKENSWIDDFYVARDIKKYEINNKEDFYRLLISTAYNITANRAENFNNIISSLHLNDLALENPNYPTEQELYDYLDSHDLLNDDNSINFEAWRKFDKEMFTLENDLEELKEGKNL